MSAPGPIADPDRVEAALAASPALAAARAELGSTEPAWVVGGAVRNAMLGHRVTDVDLAIAGDAAALSRRIASGSGAHAFELSGEFATWRVAARDGSWTLDVAELRAPTVEGDLRLRDFTVNAIAVPLAGGEAIDPTGGGADLSARVLRAASPSAFVDDPLRVLRAARIAASLELELEPGTEQLARAQSDRAGEPAGERQFAELCLLVSGPDPVRGIELLDRLAATRGVLPELDRLRGVGQSANHHLDVHEHTIEVLRRALEVEGDLERFAGGAAEGVGSVLAAPLADGLTRGAGLRFAALLHDIAKPATREEREGRVSFLGHDAVGAEQIRDLCRRLRTSGRFADYLSALTRDHLVLGFMVRERPLPPRRTWDYLRRTAPWSVDTTLLTVADRLSAQGGGVPREAIDGHLLLAREVLAAAVELDREGPGAPLLRGDELAAELGLEPGPAVGEAVRELAAAQYAGEVAGREEAVGHLRRWHESRG